jgi:tetratricopeptide (TPR) repeat protein
VSGGRAPALATVLLGALLAAVAFGAAGGTELSRTTVVEILLVLVGGAVVAAAVVAAPPGPLHGATALLAFALLAALTAISIAWAIVPELAYVEAGRTLAYLAVFAAGVAAARLAPRAGPVVLKGILAAALAALVYALAARVWPASLGEQEISNRIGQPFQYWNAVGTAAALAVPGLLWLGARRSGSGWARALAYPGTGVALLAMLLSQSRGALAAAALGTIAWLALVPLRLRSLPVLALPALGAGAVAAWALSKDAFAETAQPLAAKEAVAGDFGLLLVAMLLLLAGAGIAVEAGRSRWAAPERLRRRAGIAALAVAAVALVATLGAVAAGDRGLGGTLADRWDELTSETETAPAEQGAGRLTAAASTRAKYWKEARLIFEDRPSVGTGAGTFRVARLRHRADSSVTGHAHGYVPQTLADLGLVGLAVSLVLLLAWLVAAARTTLLHPRRLPWRRYERPLPRRDWTGERIALVALALTAIVFGLQSAIDWTWFVPGPAAMALVAAGFVAGRGPVSVERPAADPRAALDRAPPPRLLAGAGVLLAALLCAWAIWQPEAADRATADAVELADRGEVDAALAAIGDARDANPLSAEPLLQGAAIETQAGREQEAGETLEEAVLRFPGDPETWYRLAAFELGTLDEPAAAAETVRGALYLDPYSIAGRRLFLEARARAREKAR